MDVSMLKFAKGTPRVVDRIQVKRDLAQQERACRLAVKRRDKGRCVVPGCKDASAHLHHIQYRSRGGKWRLDNIASLCVKHHQMVHAALITIARQVDGELVVNGDADLLRFRL